MMDIADASTFFDDDPVYDAYTGLFLFNGQSGSYDDSSSDGATLRRRVLSVGPSVAMPQRLAVSMYGVNWLVGGGTPDGFQGEVVRQHYTMKRVTDVAMIAAPGVFLAGCMPPSAYVHKHYFKETVNALTDAETDTFWNVFVAPSEPVERGHILKLPDGTLMRVRNHYLPVEGLRVVQCDQLEPDAECTVEFQGSAYDPITDSFSGGSVTVQAYRIETAKFYRFLYLSDPSIQKGDLTFLVPTSAAPRPGAEFVVGAEKWRVLTAQPESDVVAVHARRA